METGFDEEPPMLNQHSGIRLQELENGGEMVLEQDASFGEMEDVFEDVKAPISPRKKLK